MRLDRPILLHGLRFSIAATAAAAVALVVDVHHVLWVMLTIAFVLQARLGDSLRRSTHRVLGTLVGAGLGWAVAVLLGPGHEIWLLAALPPVIFLIFLLAPVNYAVAVIFITLFVLFAYALMGLPVEGAALARAIDTAIAAIIGLGVNFVILPARASRDAQAAVPDFLRSVARRYRAGVDGLLEGRASIVDDDHSAFIEGAQQFATNIAAAKWETLPWLAAGRRRAVCAAVIVSLYGRLAAIHGLAEREPLKDAGALAEPLRRSAAAVEQVSLHLAEIYASGAMADRALFARAAADLSEASQALAAALPAFEWLKQARLAAFAAESFGLMEDLERLAQGLGLFGDLPRARPLAASLVRA